MTNYKILALKGVAVSTLVYLGASFFSEVVDSAERVKDQRTEERKLCQAYIDANLGWVKENAAVDQYGRYNFKHPNGNFCLITPTAP